MRIWYIHPYAGGPGVGRYWRPYYFAIAWMQRGHQVDVILPSFHHLMDAEKVPPATHSDKQVNYRYLPSIRYKKNGFDRLISMFFFSLCIFPWGLYSATKNGRPDLILYSSPHPYGFLPAWLLARLLRARIFFEVRDLWPLSMVELAGVSPHHPLVAFTAGIERLAYQLADKVISLLPAAEAHMRDKGLSPGKFAYVPNGIHVDDTLPLQNAEHPLVLKVREARSRGEFVVVYAGAHGIPNMLQTLVHAAGRLSRAENSDVRFILIGQGDCKPDLVDLAKELKLSSMSFYEQLPRSVVLRVLREASAGYLSLRPQPLFRFGVSPNKLWDYMSQALPVIYACHSSTDPVMLTGCGVHADPANPVSIAGAISYLRSLSQEERTRMGLRGRELVLAEHNYDHLAAKILQLVVPERP